jgi:hypothetical protein
VRRASGSPRLMRAPLAASVVVVALLAGCSDGADREDGSGFQLQAVDNTEHAGSISGVVVDDAIRPVANANLTLLGMDTTTTSDDGGLFVFPDLAPGLYTVSVAPIPEGERRFLGIQATAEVVAGETAKVRIVLPSDVTPQPYHVTLAFDGFFQVGSGFVDEVLTLAVYNHTYGPVTMPSLTCTCLWGFSSDEQVQTFVVDLAHTDTVPPPAPEFWTFSLQSDVDGSGNALWFCYDNPCLAHVPGENFSAEARNFTVHVWSDPSWVAVQQSFELFVTMFYAAPAPEGWSFIAQEP